ncbi:MAG TPA: hypothetical protein ACFYD3_03825 [Candidatus Hypogeohydataceae bacterium YC41]
MEFSFAKKMEDMCRDMLASKQNRTNRCKEIVQETHSFLNGFHNNFLQPLRQDFQAASATFNKFSKDMSRVH